MSLTIMQGDCRASLLHLPDCSVHMAVTSPPYWALRSYLPKDSPLKALELGSEETPALYIENMMAVFDQVRRVLRDDGTCWVNLGDTYSGSWGNYSGQNRGDASIAHPAYDGLEAERPPMSRKLPGLKAGDRVGIPELFAFAMRDRGWYWRDTIIWHKPAPMPSSVNGWRWERCRVKRAIAKFNDERQQPGKTGGSNGHRDCGSFAADDNKTQWSDCPGCPKCEPNDGYVLRRGSWRTTTAHEVIFLFAKTDCYFCDAEAAKEPAAKGHAGSRFDTGKTGTNGNGRVQEGEREDAGTRNPRSVWTIGPEPLKHKHYAAYPSEIPRRCIRAGTSDKGCCPHCGNPWARMVEVDRFHASGSGKAGNKPAGKNGHDMQGGGATGDIRNGPCVDSRTIGWRQTCRCPAHEPVPCVVLDPFGGSGTTAMTANLMGRHAISCELNPDYVTMHGTRRAETAPLLLAGAEGEGA